MLQETWNLTAEKSNPDEDPRQIHRYTVDTHIHRYTDQIRIYTDTNTNFRRITNLKQGNRILRLNASRIEVQFICISNCILISPHIQNEIVLIKNAQYLLPLQVFLAT